MVEDDEVVAKAKSEVAECWAPLDEPDEDDDPSLMEKGPIANCVCCQGGRADSERGIAMEVSARRKVSEDGSGDLLTEDIAQCRSRKGRSISSDLALALLVDHQQERLHSCQ